MGDIPVSWLTGPCLVDGLERKGIVTAIQKIIGSNPISPAPASIAQLVELRIEDPGVGSSILSRSIMTDVAQMEERTV